MQPAETHRTSRRKFLRDAAVGAATPAIVAASVFGSTESPPPSDRIHLGFIGVGAMGRGHLRRFLEEPAVQVLAVCDVDTWRRENAQATVEQAYAARSGNDRYHGCEAYRDLRELLAREDLDGVVIATGDRWHATATVLAAESGKDVYCEKPASLTIAEARAMVAAVRRYGRVCQIGLQQRSAREFQIACRLIHQGRLGRISHVYVHFPGTSGEVDLPAEPVPPGLDWDLWLGPAPWRPFHSRFHRYGEPQGVVPWHFCRDFGGGNLTSNAVHAFDVVQWALQQDGSGPVEIAPPSTSPDSDLRYTYADGTQLHVVDRRLTPERHEIPRGWDEMTSLQNFGGLYVGDRGWIHVGREGFLDSYPREIAAEYPVHESHAVAVLNHHRNWLDAIRTRRAPACDVAIGCQSTIVSHLGCIAHWTERTLKWDPAGTRFLDDDEANRWVTRAMRAPWQV